MSNMQWNDITQLTDLGSVQQEEASSRFERARLTPDCAAPYLEAGYSIAETLDLGTGRVPLDYALSWRQRGASVSAAIVAWEMQLRHEYA